MQTYVFLVFISAILLPDGEFKTHLSYVKECPEQELVYQLHEPKMKSGEIIDWAAACHRIPLQFDVPKELLLEEYPKKGFKT
jgi:hypothetical protein